MNLIDNQINQQASKVRNRRNSGKAPIKEELAKIKEQTTKVKDVHGHKTTKDGIMMNVTTVERKNITPNFADHNQVKVILQHPHKK